MQDKDSSDPNRVGGPSNPLLQGLTTTIGRERVGQKGGQLHVPARWQALVSASLFLPPPSCVR